MEYIWRQINPYPQKWLGIIWNIWNKIFIIMTLATKFGALGKTLASVMEMEYPEMHLEEGALSASLISRHHLNVSCCRAGAGYLKHKEAASWPLFWGQLIISPHLSSYSLFSLVVQMLSNSNFITPSHFHFGAKCPGFLLHFMWEGMSIRRELPYITPFFISLLDIITVDQYHIITLIITESF